MTTHTPRTRCRCHADETSLILCEPCLEEIRANAVVDMSPPPRNWRFLVVAGVIFAAFILVMRWAGGVA